MPTGLPPRLDLPRLADQRARIEGEIALADLPRLKDLLLANEGQARAELRFGRDGAGRPTVEGEVRATLALACQRCLERVDLEVASRFRLAAVADDRAAEELAADYEPLLVAGRELEAAALVEDELLLAAPSVPMHDDATGCGTAGRERPAAESEEARRNPFAALAALKKRS